jgi:hypothetical protein
MIGRRTNRMKDRANDHKWHHWLARYDSIAPPTAAELALLENRILSQIDTLPDDFMREDMQLAPWMLHRSWLARGVCLAAVLFALLGFLVGRDFDDLLSPSTDSATLFASADDTPWQSFITVPLSSGETDDVSE